MRITVLYRPASEFGRITEEFIRDYQMRYPDKKIEVINIDSRDGIAMSSLYDIMQFPTILATRDDGSLLKSWEGQSFPLMDELAGYAYG